VTPHDSRTERRCKPLGRLLLALLAASLKDPAAAAQSADSPSYGGNAARGDANSGLPWYARDNFDPVRFMNGFATHYVLSKDSPREPLFIFFPPDPPPLESEIPLLEPVASGPPAPPELSPFVGEIFYPFLATRLVTDDLPKAMRERILSYRDAKDQLQGELRSRILALKDHDGMERGRQLAVLASRQAPRIADLESAAEKIRSDLRPTTVLGVQLDGRGLNEHPPWRLRPVGEPLSDPAELSNESDAIQDAAFYQDGLSRGQRSLLFEAAIEVRAAAKATPADASPDSRLLDFSPEAARIRIPATLQAPLEEKIGKYLAAKDRLKTELREALRANEAAGGDARTEAMAKLASKQAARIAEVHAMAEEIRVALADLPNPPGPPVPPSLPPELMARISAYRAHKVELLRTLHSMLASPTPSGPAEPGPRNAKADGAGAMAWLHDSAVRTEIQPTDLRVSIAEFDRVQNDLISELNSEEAGIRKGLAAYVRTTKGPTDRKSINDLLRDFENARERQETWDRYRDYQTAVLMPGLSDGQRRLLFDAGVEELGLPLPAGERVN
jgi:hypothetical protein